MDTAPEKQFVAPESYDPNSPDELGAPPMPKPLVRFITDRSLLQPPLTRRGIGPGLVVIAPAAGEYSFSQSVEERPLDPEPRKKWAEEGFSVVGITVPAAGCGDLMSDVVAGVRAAVQDREPIDSQDKFGLVICEASSQKELLSPSSLSHLSALGIACVVAFSSDSTASVVETSESMPLYIHHAGENPAKAVTENVTISQYADCKQDFVLPYSPDYQGGPAGIAHTRSLVFLRKHLGGPHFDLEAIWEEHTYWEFERRSVAQTMATMVAEPYVNHVPTMTGGMGREKLTAFYRDHFVFCNPPDTSLKPISRVVGPDRVVDEFIFSCTHTSVIPWLLPNVPPSGQKLSIPMVAVINIRGDRLYHEHIWWDQGTALRQAGVLPTHVDMPDGRKQRLPVAGAESARLLLHEKGERSNEMIDPEWATK